MNRVRQPFNVNSLALVARRPRRWTTWSSSRAATPRTCRAWRQHRGAARSGSASEFIPSYGNFITVRVGKAAEIYEQLLQARRHRAPGRRAYQLPEHLRVTIGTRRGERDGSSRALAASLKD